MKTLIQQAEQYKQSLFNTKSYNLEKMRPALAALDAIAPALQAAGVSFNLQTHTPYLDSGETVIKPATGSRKDFVQVLKENGFKRAVSTACYESYTRGKAILRVYW